MQPLHMEGLQPDKAELLTDHQQLLIEPQDQSQEPVDPSNLKDKKEEEDIPTGIPDEKWKTCNTPANVRVRETTEVMEQWG